MRLLKRRPRAVFTLTGKQPCITSHFKCRHCHLVAFPPHYSGLRHTVNKGGQQHPGASRKSCTLMSNVLKWRKSTFWITAVLIIKQLLGVYRSSLCSQLIAHLWANLCLFLSTPVVICFLAVDCLPTFIFLYLTFNYKTSRLSHLEADIRGSDGQTADTCRWTLGAAVRRCGLRPTSSDTAPNRMCSASRRGFGASVNTLERPDR